MSHPKQKAIELATDCVYILGNVKNHNPLIEIKISNKDVVDRDKKAVELAILKVNDLLISGTLSASEWNYWKEVKQELELLKS